MEISLDQIYQYLNCPLKYQFQYVDKMNVSPAKSILYKQAIHKTIYFFFFAVQNGWVPKPAQMKDKWASIWQEMSGEQAEDIFSVRQSMHAKRGHSRLEDKYNISGFEMVHNFYHFNKDNPGNIIAVDLDYRVPIGGLTVTGKFELIREIVDASDGKRYIEIVDFKTSSDDIDPFLVKHDFNLTVASYAFRNLFQATEDRIKYHYLKTGRDIIITKTEDDFNRMKSIINGVADAVKTKHFYPRQSFLCKTCEFKDLCNRVKF